MGMPGEQAQRDSGQRALRRQTPHANAQRGQPPPRPPRRRRRALFLQQQGWRRRARVPRAASGPSRARCARRARNRRPPRPHARICSAPVGSGAALAPPRAGWRLGAAGTAVRGGESAGAPQVGPALGQALGQPIVIGNKVGAGGVLAAIHAAQQPADGYLLLMGANTHLVQKAMQPELGFDPIADFAPISNFAASPAMLVVNAGSAYQKLDDLMAAAKTWPGQMNYGSGGIGTAAHLAGATLVSLMGIEAVHVPL